MADCGVAPRLAEMHTAWTLRLDELLAQATLKRPSDRAHSWHGKRGQHSEHLGYILAEMQYLQRAHPGARW
jgi:ring-1,2-phenylacetyl-CoA epoxidase subunit PaaC